MAIIYKNQNQIIRVDEDVEKLEPLCTAGGNVKWNSCVEKGMVVPQKIKNRITMWSNNSTSGHIPNVGYLYTHVHSGVIFNSQKVEVT